MWFTYQRKLAMGAAIIVQAIRTLPATKVNIAYLWSVIKRIDKRLINCADDSDGVVGDCASNIIQQLSAYAKSEPDLKPMMRHYCDKK